MNRELLTIAIVGHVDHGKSTLVGRLLADAGVLPDGKLEAIREYCERNARPFEYAFILDALKDEQAQGITIDSARCFFKTALRDYTIVDAPGHIEFLKNMVSGAARADAALLVIDAHEGVRENSRRHGYFLSMLGVDQFAVVVNKMDLAGFDRAVFGRIEKEYREFLQSIGMAAAGFVPASARTGASVASRTAEMPWYDGPTVLETMERFAVGRDDLAKPLRIPVQDVYKFTARNDERRIVAGRVEAGTIRAGDAVLFSPSNKRAVVRTIERFGRSPPASAGPGESVGLTLNEQIYVTRGEVVSREDQKPPRVTSRFRADLFWLGRKPLEKGRACTFKLGAAEAPVRLEEILRTMDAASLAVAEKPDAIRRHEVAECVLKTRRPIAFDEYAEVPRLGRFVIVDDYAIAGGGIVREALPDEESALRQEASQRDRRWIRSDVTTAMRAQRYGQEAALVVITGPRGTGRKELARRLEQHLFDHGRIAYYVGMGSLVHGLDTDLGGGRQEPEIAAREHVRRLGEVAHVLLDAGLIVVCTALSLSDTDLMDIETLVAPARLVSVRIGEGGEESDLRFDAPCGADRALPQIAERLVALGVLRP